MGASLARRADQHQLRGGIRFDEVLGDPHESHRGGFGDRSSRGRRWTTNAWERGDRALQGKPIRRPTTAGAATWNCWSELGLFTGQNAIETWRACGWRALTAFAPNGFQTDIKRIPNGWNGSKPRN